MTKSADRKTRNNGRFAPGNPGGPGRPKGSKNKFTRLKETFLAALEEVGGKDYIVDFARKNPAKFLAMIARMLPTHAEPSGDEPAQLTLVIGEHAREPATVPVDRTALPAERGPTQKA